MSTVSEQPGRRTRLPTNRDRRTQAAIDAAARAVIVRKGILATTIADTAAEADRSTASLYNYYDSKEAMVREQAHEAAAAHWHTHRNRLTEMISVSPLAMVSDDFAQYRAEMCAFPISFSKEVR